MENLGYKLTVDDLIVEYMMYKVQKGYEPKFKTSEFIAFLHFFESKMSVLDVTYNKQELFDRFFYRMNSTLWSITKWSTNKKYAVPQMDMYYSIKENDNIISANYRLGNYGYEYRYKNIVSKVRQIIGEYLKDKPKRVIDENIEVSEKDLLVGKYISASIISEIWYTYIENHIELQKWPKQCLDINKYLFEMDLSEIIELKSIKNELLELYLVLSKRIAVLYTRDRELKISTYGNSKLAMANYELLIYGYENIMNTTFGYLKKTFKIDLSTSTIQENHEKDGVYYWDDDAEIETNIVPIANDNIKALVKNMESHINR